MAALCQVDIYRDLPNDVDNRPNEREEDVPSSISMDRSNNGGDFIGDQFGNHLLLKCKRQV